MSLFKEAWLNENVNDGAKTEQQCIGGTTLFSNRTTSQSVELLANLRDLFPVVDLRSGHYSSSRTPRSITPRAKKRAFLRFMSRDASCIPRILASNRGFDAHFRFVPDDCSFNVRFFCSDIAFPHHAFPLSSATSVHLYK